MSFAESESGRERQRHGLRCVWIRQTAERCRIATAEVTFGSVGKHTERTAGGKLKKKVKVAEAFFCLFVFVETGSLAHLSTEESELLHEHKRIRARSRFFGRLCGI